MTDRFIELKEKIFRLSRELCEAKVELKKVCPHKEWYEFVTVSDFGNFTHYVCCVECGKEKHASGKEKLVPKPLWR
jgi:hypothetical protein